MRSDNSAKVRPGVGWRWSGARCPGRSGNSSVVTDPKNRSILPRPCGRPTVEWKIRMRSSMAVRSRWWLVKSEPWSTWITSGMPHIAHVGSVLRQIACRSARAVFIAEGAPVKTVYPQIAREWSSITIVSQGRSVLPSTPVMRMSSSV